MFHFLAETYGINLTANQLYANIHTSCVYLLTLPYYMMFHKAMVSLTAAV